MTAIVRSKQILSGKPRIAGTAISVRLISDYISQGYSIKDIQKDYPHLSKKEISAAIAYLDRQLHRQGVNFEPSAS